jgi:outer membrane protein assembly factor BamE (lipoprotein component of BamABCDE complex)
MGVRTSKWRSAFALIVLAAALTGCGSHTVTRTVTVQDDPFAVKKGITKQQVQTVAGSPVAGSPPSPGRDCWFYAPSEQGILIHAIRFCFTNGRVSLIQPFVPGSSG